jgi:hypothetical protein
VLSSPVNVAFDLELSSAEELLKYWAFPEEFGHLRGTYEAERFLLDAFTARPGFADYFIRAFEDPRGAEFAKRVIADEDLQDFHRAIAWLALEVYKRGQKCLAGS